jgi:hypothetical protein
MDDLKFKVLRQDNKSMSEKEAEVIEAAEVNDASTDDATNTDDTASDATNDATNDAVKEIDDDLVLSHIKTKYNREVDSIEDLFKERVVQEQLDNEVDAFNKYKKETGRGLNDFVKLNRDVENEDPKKLLSDYYSEHGDDSEEISYRMSKLSYDEDLDDEDHVADRKMALKQELKKAKQYFQEQKDKYNVPLESREPIIPTEDLEDYEAYKANKSQSATMREEQQKKSQFFVEKTNELFTDSFEGFGFDVDGEKLVYKPSDVKTLKEKSSLDNFISSFLDEKGFLKDAEKFHRALAIAADPDKFAKFFMEKGVAKATTDFDKNGKNIDMRRGSTPTQTQSGITVKLVSSDQNSTFKIKKR